MNATQCPKCGTYCAPGVTSLDGWDNDLLNGYVYVDFTCYCCKTEFTNIYKIDSQHVTYNPEEEA